MGGGGGGGIRLKRYYSNSTFTGAKFVKREGAGQFLRYSNTIPALMFFCFFPFVLLLLASPPPPTTTSSFTPSPR